MERETSVLRESDAVVTLAHTMRQEIVERGVDPDKVVLAPNAVDPELLRARPDGGAYRTELGIDTQAFVIGSVSTLTHYEGFDTLIQAADHLHRQGHDIRVLLVGDGAARDDLRAQARRLGLEKICLLPGRVSPKEALRAQAALDVMVVPRLDRRVCRLVTPLKPVEAMALGIPVVASDLPALRELLDDGNSGTLVPAEAPQALAEAVGVLKPQLARCRAIALGPGLGHTPRVRELVMAVLQAYDGPVVLDADALPRGDVELPARLAPLVMTPHAGELARMLGGSTEDMQKDRLGRALEAARRHRAARAGGRQAGQLPAEPVRDRAQLRPAAERPQVGLGERRRYGPGRQERLGG